MTDELLSVIVRECAASLKDGGDVYDVAERLTKKAIQLQRHLVDLADAVLKYDSAIQFIADLEWRSVVESDELDRLYAVMLKAAKKAVGIKET